MGWALGNVWYDKYNGPPPQNSPLESLFMIIAMRRMETDLLSTRALIHASMMTPESKPDPTVKAFQEYADLALPFLAGAQDADKQNERDTLLRFTKVRARINSREVFKKQAARLNKPKGSTPDKFKLRPKMPGL